MRSVASTTVVNRVASISFIIITKGSSANPGFRTHSSTSYRHKEPEHRDTNFVWQIVCAYPTAHTKLVSLCSGSLCL